MYVFLGRHIFFFLFSQQKSPASSSKTSEYPIGYSQSSHLQWRRCASIDLCQTSTSRPRQRSPAANISAQATERCLPLLHIKLTFVIGLSQVLRCFFDISAKGPECFRVLFQQPNLNLRVSAIMKTTRVFEFLDIEVRRVIHFKAAMVIMGYNQDFLDFGKRLPVTSRTLGNIFM